MTTKLRPQGEWQDRWGVTGDSGTEYVVARKADGSFGCSCPGWKFKRPQYPGGPRTDCKHILRVRQELAGRKVDLGVLPTAIPPTNFPYDDRPQCEVCYTRKADVTFRGVKCCSVCRQGAWAQDPEPRPGQAIPLASPSADPSDILRRLKRAQDVPIADPDFTFVSGRVVTSRPTQPAPVPVPAADPKLRVRRFRFDE